MKAIFILLSIISLIIVVVAVVIMLGHGDDFIVGYNIASKKTRDMYDIRHVRIIVGVLLIIIALVLPTVAALLIMGYREQVMRVLPSFAIILIAATFTVSHLWAKKKGK